MESAPAPNPRAARVARRTRRSRPDRSETSPAEEGSGPPAAERAGGPEGLTGGPFSAGTRGESTPLGPGNRRTRRRRPGPEGAGSRDRPPPSGGTPRRAPATPPTPGGDGGGAHPLRARSPRGRATPG